MKIIILICTTASSFILSGCSVFESSARKHQLVENGTSAYWFDYNSDRRGAFILPGDKNFKIISEPSPDTAIQNILKMAGSLNYQGVTGQLSADLSQQIVQLGQRTEMIMFLRETMFRLSEAGNNAGWKDNDYKDLYTQIVNASVTLAQTEKTEAEAKKIKAETEWLKAQNAIRAIEVINPTTNSSLSNPMGIPAMKTTNQPPNPELPK